MKHSLMSSQHLLPKPNLDYSIMGREALGLNLSRLCRGVNGIYVCRNEIFKEPSPVNLRSVYSGDILLTTASSSGSLYPLPGHYQLTTSYRHRRSTTLGATHQMYLFGPILVGGPLDPRGHWTLSTLSTSLLRPWLPIHCLSR